MVATAAWMLRLRWVPPHRGCRALLGGVGEGAFGSAVCCNRHPMLWGYVTAVSPRMPSVGSAGLLYTCATVSLGSPGQSVVHKFSPAASFFKSSVFLSHKPLPCLVCSID